MPRFELVMEEEIEQKKEGVAPSYVFHIDESECYDEDSVFDSDVFDLQIENFDNVVAELNPECSEMLIRVANLGWKQVSGERIIDSADGEAIRRSFHGDYSLCYGKTEEKIPGDPLSTIITCTLYEHDTPTGAPIEIWPFNAVLSVMKQALTELLWEKEFLIVSDMQDLQGNRFCLGTYGHCYHPYKVDLEKVVSQDSDYVGTEDTSLTEDRWEMLVLEDLRFFCKYFNKKLEREKQHGKTKE